MLFLIIQKIRGIEFKLSGRRSLLKEWRYHFIYIPIILWSSLPEDTIKGKGINVFQKTHFDNTKVQ